MLCTIYALWLLGTQYSRIRPNTLLQTPLYNRQFQTYLRNTATETVQYFFFIYVSIVKFQMTNYPCTEHMDLILNILYINQFKKLNEWHLVVHTVLWHIQHGPRGVHRQSLEACLPWDFWVHASLLSLLPPEMNKV